MSDSSRDERATIVSREGERQRKRRWYERRRSGQPSVAESLIRAQRLSEESRTNKSEINRAAANVLLEWASCVIATGNDPLKDAEHAGGT